MSVNGHDFPYERVTAESYVGSPMARQNRTRRYYFHPDHVVKEYHFDAVSEQELRQPLREIDLNVNVLRGASIWHAALLSEFEISGSWVRIVYPTVAGDLLHDCSPVEVDVAVQAARDVLRTLGDLSEIGLHHNDIRSWNIIFFGPDGAWLIDYGLAWYAPTESGPVALVWALHAALTGEQEPTNTGKTELPPREPFVGTPLERLHDLVGAGEQSWAVLRESVELSR